MQTLADRLRAEGEKIGMVRGEKKGMARGEKKGMARGEKTGKRKTAKALLEKGVDIDLLVEATGLTKKELEKLARTNH